MEYEVLKEIIEEHTEDAQQTKGKTREIEQEIKKYMQGEEIIILSGVRRSGKTYIMYNLMKKFPGIFINFEDERLMDFSVQDFQKIELFARQSNYKYIYLDEVQNISGWERFVRRVHKKFKIIVTGSNSSLLKGEYASALTGRTITFQIYPLSYKEFILFKGLKKRKDSFIKYLEIGGFPRVALTEDKRILEEYFNTILYKDIIPRYGFRYLDKLEKLAHYLLSNVGKPISYRSLASYLSIKHEQTIKEYIRVLEENYLIKILYKWDLSLKKMNSYEKKIFAIDHSFAYLGTRIEQDKERILENLVFLELFRKYKNIYFYKNKGEVDFLICDGLKPLKGINVSLEINEKNIKREQKALIELKNNLKIEVLLTSLFIKKEPIVEFKYIYNWLIDF